MRCSRKAVGRMGDDRPAVYKDEGTWVYRASALGGCERALLAARRGETRTPPPASLQEKYDQGHAAEDTIMGRWARDHADKYTLVTREAGEQVKVEIGKIVSRGMVAIRGSLDGFGAVLGDPEDVVPVDAKAFGKSFWDKLDKEGIWGFPYYCTQLVIYAEGLRARGLYVDRVHLAVALKNDDGEVTGDSPIRYVVTYLDELAERGYTIDALWEKVERVEKAYRDEADYGEFACPKEGGVWGCPYPQVEDRVEHVLITGKGLVEFTTAVSKLEEIRAQEKALKDEKAKATATIKGLVDQHGKRIKGAGKKVTWVRTERPERTVTYKASVSEYPKITDDRDDDIDKKDDPFETG
jgi:hypothetical protein